MSFDFFDQVFFELVDLVKCIIIFRQAIMNLQVNIRGLMPIIYQFIHSIGDCLKVFNYVMF
jgi:hypothetical protein